MYRLFVVKLAILWLWSGYVYGQLPIIVRGPYLQNVTENSITVRWRTDSTHVGVVRLGTSTTLGTQFSESSAGKDHIVGISGLQPNTKYFYSTGDTKREWAKGETYFFKTAPIQPSSLKTNIWLLGDFGIGSERQVKVKNQILTYLDKNKIDYLNLWLWLGDNAYESGTDDAFQKLNFNVYQPDKIMRQTPFYGVPGNHDYSNTHTLRDIPYLQLISKTSPKETRGIFSDEKRYYSFDYQNIHFVMLDSYGHEDGAVFQHDKPQMKWLVNDLETTKNDKNILWTIVIFHHPPYTKGTYDSDISGELSTIRVKLLPILDNYKVDMIFSGHSHVYERFRMMKGHYGLQDTYKQTQHLPKNANALGTGRYDGSQNSCPYIKQSSALTNEGAVYIVAGSGGAYGRIQPTWPHKTLVFGEDKGGSVMLQVEQNRIDFRWIDEDGKIGDQFTMMKDVNTTKNISVTLNDSVSLEASWPGGSYRWNDGISSTKKKSFKITQETQTFIVRDEFSCLADTFNVKALISSIGSNPQMDVCISPNPTSNEVKITFPSSYEKLVLYDTNGRIVETKNLPNNEATLQMEKYPNGLYMLELQGKIGFFRGKIIKK